MMAAMTTIDYGGTAYGQTWGWCNLVDGTTAGSSWRMWQPVATQTQTMGINPWGINPYWQTSTASNTNWVAVDWGTSIGNDLLAAAQLWYRNYATGNWTAIPPKSPTERLREIIRARQAPLYLPSHRKLLLPTDDARELRARATFRRIVGEHNWRSYCARGYVSVQGASGKVYQIFAGHDVTRVYDQGRLIERLCIVLRGDYPPTDSILMRYVMVLSDEAGFRKQANRTVCSGENPDGVSEREVKNDLLTEWRRIKGLAA